MAPTLTATRGTVYEDTLERDNADVLSSRLNDIGDPTKWVTAEEGREQMIKMLDKLERECSYA
jgi:hypothetical protein